MPGLSRMLSAIWISILIGFVFIVVLLAVVLVFVIPAAAGNHAVGILAAIVIGLAAVVFLLWFYVCAHLATPLLMLENARGRKAIARATHLVRGSWWSVFGTMLLMGLIVSVGGIAVGVLFAVLLLAAHGDTTATIAINFLVRTVSLVIFTPLSSSIAVILAIDMRVRKEGFDIQYLAATLGTSAQPPPGSFIRMPYGPPGRARGLVTPDPVGPTRLRPEDSRVGDNRRPGTSRREGPARAFPGSPNPSRPRPHRSSWAARPRPRVHHRGARRPHRPHPSHRPRRHQDRRCGPPRCPRYRPLRPRRPDRPPFPRCHSWPCPSPAGRRTRSSSPSADET